MLIELNTKFLIKKTRTDPKLIYIDHKIELKANATGINPITGKADGKIIVKADGYGFDVSGLANGAEVMVYSQNGMLIGKAKAKGGSAHVDAASYPNGVYVIKAGGRSLKMVKK